MGETLPNHLDKLAENTKVVLTHPSAEQPAKDNEAAASSVQNKPAPQHKKREPHAPLTEQKSKKHRIPFIILALVLLFSSLCVLSLVSQQPLAWATTHSSSAVLHHSASTSLQEAATPAGNCVITDCYGSPAKAESWGVYTHSLASDCSNHYKTMTGDDFCWNNTDFQWGNRDITCVQNTHLADQQKQMNSGLGLNFGPTTVSANGGPETQSTPGSSNTIPSGTASGTAAYNQNTCTNDSTCFSDNRSNNDDSGQIHDLIGGDDLICFNNICINKGGSGTHPNCGGEAFDKFACSPIMNGSQPTNFFYNPTSYYPSGAYETANADLSLNGQNGSIQTGGSGDKPTCEGNNSWVCPNGDNVYLAMADNSNGTFANPFTGNPEEISATTTTNYQASGGGGSGNGGPGGSAATNSTTTSSYPPRYAVGCYAANSNWVFPCSDKPNNGEINETALRNDWLSGDKGATTGSEKHPGHLSVTYADETHALPKLESLSSLSLTLGYLLITPSLILIGYQLLWSSWSLRRVATMEMFARLLLSIIAVSISYELTTMLIGLSNLASQAVVTLHTSLGYPDITLNGTNLTYTLNGEQADPSSFRGIVMPISRWGCAMNDFMGILEDKLITDGLAYLPFVGGFVKLAKGIHDAIKAFKDIGEFLVLLLSINLCVQVFVRVALVNYYILTAPLALGCWGLPGNTGQKVVSQWFTGFCSILFVQAVQLLVLTTMPLLLPTIPQLPTDTLGILYTILAQLPRVIVLMAVTKAPAMLGAGSTKAIAKAGSMSSGAIAAVGAAAYGVV